jgi:hypothetical protein
VKGHLVLGSDETSSGHQLEELQVGGGGCNQDDFHARGIVGAKNGPIMYEG